MQPVDTQANGAGDQGAYSAPPASAEQPAVQPSAAAPQAIGGGADGAGGGADAADAAAAAQQQLQMLQVAQQQEQARQAQLAYQQAQAQQAAQAQAAQAQAAQAAQLAAQQQAAQLAAEQAQQQEALQAAAQAEQARQMQQAAALQQQQQQAQQAAQQAALQQQQQIQQQATMQQMQQAALQQQHLQQQQQQQQQQLPPQHQQQQQLDPQQHVQQQMQAVMQQQMQVQMQQQLQQQQEQRRQQEQQAAFLQLEQQRVLAQQQAQQQQRIAQQLQQRHMQQQQQMMQQQQYNTGMAPAAQPQSLSSAASSSLSSSWGQEQQQHGAFSQPLQQQYQPPPPQQQYIPPQPTEEELRKQEEDYRRQQEVAEAERLKSACPRCEHGGSGALCVRHEKERLSKVCEWCEKDGTGPLCREHEPKTMLTQEQLGCHTIMEELMSKHHQMKLKAFYTAPRGVGQAKAMTLNKVTAKITHTWQHTCEYTSITDFASDLRKIAMAGYNKFGPQHDHAQNALMIEKILDQKVAMLSAAMREKASLATTNALWAVEKGLAQPNSGRRSRRAAAPTPLIKLAESEWEEREKVEKKRREIESKEQNDRQQSEIIQFEDTFLNQTELFALQAMWEIPAMGVLLYLLQDAMRLVDFSLTSLEIGILQPQWSKELASVFVGLLTKNEVLSSRKQGDKEQRNKLLAYDNWHQLLEDRMEEWYGYRNAVVAQNDASPVAMVERDEDAVTKDGDKIWNANELPDEPEPSAPPAEQDVEIQSLLDVLGEVNPLSLHKFHALPVFYRVRILYTLISSTIAGAGPEGVEAHKYTGGSSQDSLIFKQKLMQYESKDMRGQMLGEDSAGDRYFYCPQFDTSDFRLYRQAQKVTLKQRQEAKRLEEEKARVQGKGRKRGSAAVEEPAKEPKKKAKAKAKPKPKPKAKKPPTKPKKVPRQGSRRSGRGQKDPEPTPEEEVAKMEQEQAMAAAAEEAAAEVAGQEEVKEEMKEEPTAAATEALNLEVAAAAAVATVEVKAEEDPAAAVAAAAAAEDSAALATTVQDHEAKVWDKLLKERAAATVYVETYCVAPEIREEFEIICDEMSAEGAWGEFVYQKGISKVRTVALLRSVNQDLPFAVVESRSDACVRVCVCVLISMCGTATGYQGPPALRPAARSCCEHGKPGVGYETRADKGEATPDASSA